MVQRGFDDPLSADQLAGIRTGSDLFESVWGSGSSAQISIDMNDVDRNDVAIVLTKGVTIPVQIGIEGMEWTSVKSADDIRVSLAPKLSGMPYKQGSRPNAGGNARIDDVSPGQYRVSVDHPPAAGLYVKEVLYGRTEAQASPIDVTDQQPDAITVVLSNKGGQVEGRVTDAQSKPVSGVQVVLIPDDRDRSRLFKTTLTDREGRFTFRAIAPGGYKVFSWESLDEGDYFSKEILAKSETQGRPARVQESSKETVDVRIIPTPQE